jgi:DNA-binding PadR family transcriptional regulator
VVLGLLVREPANCYQLDKSLEKRFDSAQYSRGTAKQAIKRLVDNGLVRVRESRQCAASTDGGRASVTTYEVTPAGVQRFEEWMRASACTPPVREELHAKIVLCEPQHLPRMIEVVRESEIICARRLEELNRRIQSRRSGVATAAWGARMDLAVVAADHAWWDGRIKWLQNVRIYLQEEWARWQAGQPAHSPGLRLAR